MDQFQSVTVWLSYVSYPATTAVYFERAFREICRVVTVGPRLPEEFIERWALQNMKQPIRSHDIDTTFTPDFLEILRQCPSQDHPDLFLMVESTGGFSPVNMQVLQCPKVCYLIDSHLHLDNHLEVAKHFDFVFIAQRAYLDDFRAVNPRTYWLPLACDPEVHGKNSDEKKHDVGFVGGVSAGTRRAGLLAAIRDNFDLHFERCFWDDMARLYSESRVVFNEAVNHDLNMRFFEALASGSLLLSDMAKGSGQSELFVEGEDYMLYNDRNLLAVARFCLDNERVRERIARRGRHLVLNAHTYRHRVEDLLNVVLGGKPDTFSPAELRQQSLAGVQDADAGWRTLAQHVSVAPRSFVIPVLDYSPASEYNILTLLADLDQVSGDVIVVFNSEQVARELRDHPRITHHVVMSRNIGVARAWNVGLDVAESPTVFILNADLHVSAETIDVMEQGLWSLDRAACVGPQGSFVNFAFATDHVYFDKGTFSQPMEVDAVSGFLFCVKRELFDSGALKFEGAYTPCYFEEWDLGLQIKMAGYKCYVVPTTGYEHHWSGTIRALRTIPYLGREETAGEILLRNRDLFLTKWHGIARRSTMQGKLLQSMWCEYGLQIARQRFLEGQFHEAAGMVEELLTWFPDEEQLLALQRMAGLQLFKSQARVDASL